MIPVVEERIKENRQKGSKIEKNVILDFSKVEHVDSSLIASHLLHLREYQEKGFQIVLLNVTRELKSLLDVFHESDKFKIFTSEEEAIQEMNS